MIKKLKKFIFLGIAAFIGLSSPVYADEFSRGMNDFRHYIYFKTHVDALQFEKMLGIVTDNDLRKLFKDNWKPLLTKLRKMGKNKLADLLEKKIVSNPRVKKEVEYFLINLSDGMIPSF